MALLWIDLAHDIHALIVQKIRPLQMLMLALMNYVISCTLRTS